MMTTVQQMSSFEFQMVCAVRLILASCCGLCIGIERTNRLKDAGIRTHLIVCMGAALMMLVSKYGFFDVSPLTEFFKADVSRVASSVVSGVGFLGAGIIFERNRRVTGLPPASGPPPASAWQWARGCISLLWPVPLSSSRPRACSTTSTSSAAG